MSINRYRAFSVAAELESITRAAEKLGYTQSGISHLIGSLEDELGLQLLTRSKMGARLTPEGAALLPYVNRLLNGERDVEDMAAQLRGSQAGTLRVATVSSIAYWYLPALLKSFREAHPKVEIKVQNGSYDDVERALTEGSADCGFVTLPTLPELYAVPLLNDRLMVLVNEGDPLSESDELSAAALMERPFILPAEGSHYDIGKAFAAEGIQPNIIMEMRDDYAAAAMVRQNLGVTILPELMATPLLGAGIRAVPLKNSSRTVGIAARRGGENAPLLSAFLAEVIGHVRPRAEGSAELGL